MLKTYKNTFLAKSAKMEKNNVEDKNKINRNIVNEDYILRFCASEKSIPKESSNINLIYGKTWEFGEQELFNKYTNLPFGYSYKIEKKYNIHPKRIIEYDINANIKNYEIMTNYNNFVNYYEDEEFEMYQNNFEEIKKPEFMHNNIILDGYDTDDSIKIIKEYNRKIKNRNII